MNSAEETMGSEGSYTYKIQAFSEVRKTQQSPYFRACGFRWFIVVQPDFNTAEPNPLPTSLSVYLSAGNENDAPLRSFYATVEFRLLSCAGDKPMIKNLGHIFQAGAKNRGFAPFCTWAEIIDPKNGFIENDSITLEVTIRTDHKLPEHDDTQRAALLCQLVDDFQNMYERKIFTDFTVRATRAQKKDFKVHKAVLAARSSIFYAMICSNTEVSNNDLLIIEDFDSDVIEELLRYLYEGTVDDNSNNFIGLHKAADKYELYSLGLLCEEKMISSCTYKNAIEIAIHADQHKCMHVKEKAVRVIIENMSKVAELESFQLMCKNHTKLMQEIASKTPSFFKSLNTDDQNQQSFPKRRK